VFELAFFLCRVERKLLKINKRSCLNLYFLCRVERNLLKINKRSSTVLNKKRKKTIKII